MTRVRGAASAGLICICFSLIALAGPAARADAPAAAAAPEAPLVETLLSRAAPYAPALTLTATTAASRRVVVSAQTAGLVVSETRRKGAEVAQGDLLCRIEAADRPARLAEAQARLAEADAAAKASAALASKGFSAELKRAADRAALEAARAAAAAAKLDLARVEMRAPFAGRLESDAAETGALLNVGDPCAELIALDPIRFVAFPSETEIARVREEAAATAILLDGREVAARITFVARAADPATRTFRVEASAPNGGASPIRDGVTAALRLPGAEVPAHRLPRSALMLDEDQRLGVMLAEDGRARFQRVEILSDGAEAIWVSGPPQEAQVVTTGQYLLTDGAALRAKPRRDGPPNRPGAAEEPTR